MNAMPVPTQTRRSALEVMASRLDLEPRKLLDTLKATVFKGASDEQMVALVVVANQHGLNPFTREIYAFPAKGGGIQPVVSIDGWIRLMNSRPDFDGLETMFSGEGKALACTASIHVKGRSKPVVITEYLSECYRKTETWDTWPRRMLRHKAIIQGARVAFGFGGIADEDEAARVEVGVSSPPSFPRPNFLPAADRSPPAGEPDAALEQEPAPPATSPAGDEEIFSPAAGPVLSPAHAEFGAFLEQNGIGFGALQAWAVQTQWEPNWETYGSLPELPVKSVARLLRSKAGLLKQFTAAAAA